MNNTRITISKRGAVIFITLFVLVIAALVYYANIQAIAPFHNCSQIKAITGRSNIPIGDKLYNPALDRNRDGVACE